MLEKTGVIGNFRIIFGGDCTFRCIIAPLAIPDTTHYLNMNNKEDQSSNTKTTGLADGSLPPSSTKTQAPVRDYDLQLVEHLNELFGEVNTLATHVVTAFGGIITSLENSVQVEASLDMPSLLGLSTNSNIHETVPCK